ncbi:TFIP11 (predicted) [Pycnogonum litorale]
MNNYSERKDVELPDRYHRLVWEIWMPFVRKTITNTWSARDSDPLIEFLENWMPIIPQWITENILEQLALPRLQNEVDVWNPLTDTMPIHSWLHPWLPLMGEKLEPLYLPIRQKFGSALTCWHPSDGSAKLILQPWVQVFSKGTMQAFVVRHILPKLVTVVQEFVINPHQQHLDPWKWVMLWEEFLPLQSLVSLLDKNFFPQWTQVLCTWLNSDPDFEEVTKWYQGWKSMFSSQLLADRAIKNRFNQALDFMDRSVSQPSRPRFPQNNVGSSPLLNNVPRPPQRFNTHDNNQPYYPLPHRMPNNSPQRDYEAIMVRGASSAASVNMNFRDLIGHKAEENNLIFVPVPDRFYEGKQVYRFGHLLICIDRTVIFYLNPDNQMWLPTSIGNLLSMCI